MQRDSGAPLYEFFAGGGMARLGLAPDFACVFANDIDPAKASAYRAAFGDADMRVGDVWKLGTGDLPGQAALAWASFPCQDLSLAGARRGLAAPRSGAFWGFHRLIEKLAHDGRAPDVLALENVTGLISSHGGADFTALMHALDGLG
jgi:DNA (cytosine-5)-methyltransferase 1